MSNDAHRITLAQLGEFLTQLGIDWTPDDLQGIVIEPGKVTVTRYRCDENGGLVVLPGHDELATEVVTIPIEAEHRLVSGGKISISAVSE
jgi:hypothetical protein